jgi:hypothetical protein
LPASQISSFSRNRSVRAWSSWGAQHGFRDDLREPHLLGAVDQAEGDGNFRIEHPDELVHQEFVEIGVQQRADDRVEPIIVVVDPGGEIHHGNANPDEVPAIGTGRRGLSATVAP